MYPVYDIQKGLITLHTVLIMVEKDYNPIYLGPFATANANTEKLQSEIHTRAKFV